MKINVHKKKETDKKEDMNKYTKEELGTREETNSIKYRPIKSKHKRKKSRKDKKNDGKKKDPDKEEHTNADMKTDSDKEDIKSDITTKSGKEDVKSDTKTKSDTEEEEDMKSDMNTKLDKEDVKRDMKTNLDKEELIKSDVKKSGIEEEYGSDHDESHLNDIYYNMGGRQEFEFKFTDEEIKERIRHLCPVHGLSPKKNLSKRKIITIIVFALTAIAIIALAAILIYNYVLAKEANALITNDNECTNAPPETNETIGIWNNYRLPSFMVPERYEVFLNPSMTELLYSGMVIISFQVLEETNFIVLHYVELKPIEMYLKDNDMNVSIIETKYIENNEQLYITFQNILKPNRIYHLIVRFLGSLKREGLYYIEYNGPSPGKRYVLFSRTQSMDARKLFPCFDEPAMKATFQLSITHWSNHTAYSNTEKTDTYINSDMEVTTTEFKKTKNMSTYLIAFAIIADCKDITENVNGINFTFIIPKDVDENKCRDTLSTLSIIFKQFTSLFKIESPLLKLGFVSVPTDYSLFIEKWGLIIFGKNFIHFINHEFNIHEYQEIIISISQALVQQWFGNLITPEWWSEIWINRGLASFFKYHGINHIRPNMADQLVTRERLLALISDDSAHAPALRQNVSKNTDIYFALSSILYHKGACIIRMMENFIGRNIFNDGIRNYLEKHMYGNVSTEDLWESLRKFAPQWNIKDLMDPWIHTNSYPLIHAELTNNSVKLRQTCFRNQFVKILNDSSPCDFKWFIPVTFITNVDNNPQTHWLNMTDAEIPIQIVQWIKLNVKAVGYYRVMYDMELWDTLINKLHRNHKVFTRTDRSNLIDDAFALASVKVLDVSYPLKLCSYLKDERDSAPWYTAVHYFKEMYGILKIQSVDKAEILKNFSVKLMKPHVYPRSLNDEKINLNKPLNYELLEAMKSLEENDVSNDAYFRFLSWKMFKERVPQNSREFVYKAGVKFGDKSAWDHLKKQFDNESDRVRLMLLLRAMAQTKDINVTHRYLDEILVSSKLTPDMVLAALLTLMKDSIFRKDVWAYIKNNFPNLLNKCKNDYAKLSLLSETLSYLNEKDQYDEVKTLISEIHSKNIKKLFLQALEKINLNVFWLKNVQPDVISFLNRSDKNYSD